MRTSFAALPVSCMERWVVNSPRHPRLLATALATLLALSGCAWEAGQPWGVWHTALRLRATVAKDRQLPEGRFRTASEYIWQVESLQVELAEMQLQLAGDAAQLSFDPAKPPSGFSLCHGGHCHASDGRLVDYAEIQEELLGSSAGLAKVVMPIPATAAVAGEYGPALQPATKELPRGALATLRLSWNGVRLRARVWDGAPGGKRLPTQGIIVDISLPAASVAAQLKGQVGPHEPLNVHTRVDLDVPVAFLDGFDVAPLVAGASQVNGQVVLQLPSNSAAAVALSEAWLVQSQLAAVVSRAP